MIRPYREADLGRALGFYRRLGFRPLEAAAPGESAGEITVVYLGRRL